MSTKPDTRNRFYKLLQVGKKQLCMDDDVYRDFLALHGAQVKNGRASASTMSLKQLFHALEAMKRAGFTPRAKAITDPQSDWRRPRINKIIALWCTLADAGVVKDRSEKAMNAWCMSITKKARLEWAASADLNACIEGLKKWAWREKVKLRD